MTSNKVPVYRHGRKFYVSVEEYARIRAEEQRQRRSAAQKSQHIPVPKSQQTSIRTSSASLYNSVQRSHSNPYEQTYGILKTPRVPANSLVNAVNRYEPNRLSRSTLRRADNPNALPTKHTPVVSVRSNSSDKVLDLRKTGLTVFDPDDEFKPTYANELPQSTTVSPRPSRRPMTTLTSNYGISPTTTISMTPTDQTHTQTTSSKLTSYLTRTRQSSLNPSLSNAPTTTPFLETGIQGSTQTYAVLGSTSQRPSSGHISLVNRSASESSKNRHPQRIVVNDSFSNENSNTLSKLSLRQRSELNSHRPSECIGEAEIDSGQQRELCTRSTHRSQSTDGLTEKKRVRFADMEGLTLESKSSHNSLSTPTKSTLLSRRQYIKLPSEIRGRPRPFYNTLYQATSELDESTLATDV
ncbi:unnamed protein product [Adineta ricciae]|uniref:Uncharacterized protein n=1 Tax=Adineta ricciae TaxID=249248 RepID=A0A814EZX0_ADIRI|nr:unnamed protein product [Adineta ricciae]